MTKLERARGTRDFTGEEALLRQEIVATLRTVFELYGYSPLETPALERFETLASKYAGGAEILKETFKLKDQGDRELALRYDLTVPMCRFIATNPNLKMPFKRYQIGSVFRDGPLKAGRYREFAQCDVDIVGVKSMAADAEMVKIAIDAFERLGLNVEIQISNRKFLDAALLGSGVPKDKLETAILSLDKIQKIGKEEVKRELASKGIGKKAVDAVFSDYVGFSGDAQELKKLLGKNEGVEEVEELLGMVKSEKVKFNTMLARGLAYYTGTVFEAFLKGSPMTSSIAAGGRYDKMIGDFLGSGSGSGREYPAVGISFGLDIIQDALLSEKKNGEKTTAVAYVIPIKAGGEAQKIAAQLRKAGVNTDIDMNNRDIKRNLEYAAAAGIPYAILVGEKEVKEGKITVRDIHSGKEELLTVSGFISKLNIKS